MDIQVIGVGYDKPIELKAKCGHVDPLGYFAGTVYRVARSYYGYTKAQAVALFRADIKAV